MSAFDPGAIAPGVLRAACAALSATGRVHIPALLSPTQAKALHEAMQLLDWRLVMNGSETVYDFRGDDLAALDLPARGRLLEIVYGQAQVGFQFLFDSYRISDECIAGGLREGSLFDWYHGLNSEAGLSMLRVLTGDPRVQYADAQATRYRRGHFLTEHLDDVDGKNRLFAYVLNLTPAWRADWGGLLTFTGPDGHVEEAYAPKFGALNIFRVPQPHSVSYVTPFAGAARFSITGWLRSAVP